MAAKLKRKSLSIFLVLVMLVSLFSSLGITASAAPSGYWTDSGNYNTDWYDTTETSFTLNKPEEFAGLAAIVNGVATGVTQDSFAGKTVALGADIDLSDHYWYPIGGVSPLQSGAPSGYFFAGTFDGYRANNLATYNTHIIAGVDIQYITTTPANNSGYGLFGYVNGGTLTNLTLRGEVDVGSNDVSAIGGLVGYTNGDVYNIHNEMPVTMTNTNSSMLGGVAGTVENNDATKTVQVRYCSNIGEITGRGRVGGIVGAVYCQNAGGVIVDNCYSRGDMHTVGSNQKSYVGGIVGYSRGYLSNNYVTNTTITTLGGHYQGGIAGLLQGVSPQAQMSTSYAAVVFGTGCDPEYDKAMTPTMDNSNTMPIVDCLYDSTLAGSYANPPGTGSNGWGWWTDSGPVSTAQFTDAVGTATVYTSTGTGTDTRTLGVLTILGLAYLADTTNINGGYPVLDWQINGVPPYGPVTYQGIYLDGVDGNDNDDGLTPATAVKTFAVAQSKLTSALPNVLVCGTVTISGVESWTLGSGQAVVRAAGFTGTLVDVVSGGSIEILAIELNGNRVAVPAANAALITIDGGAVFLGKGALLTDNANVGTSAVGGGAITLNTGSIGIADAVIRGNAAAQGGGAVWVANTASASFTLSPPGSTTISDEVYLDGTQMGSVAVINVGAPLTGLTDVLRITSAYPLANLPIVAGSGYTLTAADDRMVESTNLGWYVELNSTNNQLVLRQETGVFLDGISGSDSNDGTTARTPVATLSKAISLLPAAGGTIYVLDTVLVTSAVDDSGASGKAVTLMREEQNTHPIFMIENNAVLTLTYVTVDGNYAHTYLNNSPLVAVVEGTLNLAGATLQNNYSDDGGAVNVLKVGTVTMSAGSIAGNHAQRGAGVFIDVLGIFNMTGGTISGNDARNTGGALFDGGTATLSGGTISANSAGAGGAVRVSGGALTVSGASITGNNASNGGAVYISDMGSVIGAATISGGTISGNTATNDGAGIYVSASNELTLAPSGAGAVSFGTGAAANDIYLPNGVTFGVGASLSTGIAGSLPVSMANPAVNQIVAEVTGSYSSFTNPDNLKFTYFGGGHTFKRYGTGNIQIAIAT